MSLFTDVISTVQDLINQDSSVLATAQNEDIDLNQKLTAAKQEIGIELTTLLQQSNTYDWQFWLQPNPQLNNIVVTPPLQLWHTYHSLALVYRDAYGSQLNDRYQGKRTEFQQLAKWAMEKLIETGVGIASDPIPQAVPPLLTAIPGGQPAMTYFASVSWLNVEGEEGQAGNASTLDVAAGNTLAVQVLNRPANAVTWNVFVGPLATALALQNPTPLDPNQIWIQSTSLSTTGRAPGTGQAPNYLRALPRVIQRG
jgi:hypothetical protein